MLTLTNFKERNLCLVSDDIDGVSDGNRSIIEEIKGMYFRLNSRFKSFPKQESNFSLIIYREE